ncbi:MAG: hypothetical protein LBP30_04520 [Clostridiales Family XIII bacterium]|jgi:hypothetical protein|nr:hypothetical protein [Clostridiales Family XIII bacterium]
MIRPLSDINEEFFAETVDAGLPAQDVSPHVEGDDAADLMSSFEEESETKPHRSPLRYAIPVILALAAILLLVMAIMLGMRDGDASDRKDVSADAVSPPSGADVSEDAGESGETAAGAGGDSDSGANADSDSDANADSDSDASADSDEGTDAPSADLSASLAEVEIAALYLYILGPGLAEDADLSADPAAEPSRTSRLADRIDAHISEMAGKGAATLPPNDEINSDLEFTRLTEPANALVNAINAGREAKSRLPEVIDLRERAYAMYPVRVLKKLLAVDYEDFGSHCAPDNASEAFDAFVYAIKYRMEYLSELPYAGGAQRRELGRVAGTYAKIAEIEGLDAAIKRHAAFIADCLYGPAARGQN